MIGKPVFVLCSMIMFSCTKGHDIETGCGKADLSVVVGGKSCGNGVSGSTCGLSLPLGLAAVKDHLKSCSLPIEPAGVNLDFIEILFNFKICLVLWSYKRAIIIR